jgi:hypothetical protein
MSNKNQKSTVNATDAKVTDQKNISLDILNLEKIASKMIEKGGVNTRSKNPLYIYPEFVEGDK